MVKKENCKDCRGPGGLLCERHHMEEVYKFVKDGIHISYWLDDMAAWLQTQPEGQFRYLCRRLTGARFERMVLDENTPTPKWDEIKKEESIPNWAILLMAEGKLCVNHARGFQEPCNNKGCYGPIVPKKEGPQCSGYDTPYPACPLHRDSAPLGTHISYMTWRKRKLAEIDINTVLIRANRDGGKGPWEKLLNECLDNMESPDDAAKRAKESEMATCPHCGSTKMLHRICPVVWGHYIRLFSHD